MRKLFLASLLLSALVAVSLPSTVPIANAAATTDQSVNEYEVVLYPKGSSNRIVETIKAGTSNDARKVIEARYPGCSIVSITKK